MSNLAHAGLLGSLKSKEELEKEEKDYQRAEQVIRKVLDLRRRLVGPQPVPMGGLMTLARDSFDWGESQAIVRDERLLNFAVKRRMPLDGDWISRAIYWAAMEHEELKSEPKRRGRKSKIKFGWSGQYGLLGPLKNEDELYLEAIEDKMRRLAEGGQPPTQQAAIEWHLVSDEGYSPTDFNLHKHIQARVTKIARIKKKLQRPKLKPGPKAVK